MRRSEEREQAFYLVFESMFSGEPSQAVALYSEAMEPVGDYARAVYDGVCEKQEELDAVIETYLKGWKINRLPKVNLSILRLAVYEISYCEDVPDSVAINEAVELGKKYAGKEDAAFINGVLGAFVRSRA